MSLVKYNTNLSPLLGDFFDIFDAFDPITRPVSNVSNPKAFVDSQERQHVITMSTPGISREDLNVDIGDGRITISFDHKSSENSNFRFQKSFTRSWSLPKDVKAEGIEANYENGILSVVIPKNEKTTPVARRITIG